MGLIMKIMDSISARVSVRLIYRYAAARRLATPTPALLAPMRRQY